MRANTKEPSQLKNGIVLTFGLIFLVCFSAVHTIVVDTKETTGAKTWGLPVSSDRYEGDGWVMVYDRRTRTPRYVLEYLTKDRLGKAGERDGNWKEPQTAQEFKASLSAYVGSGYDRGHQAPAADFAVREDNSKSFDLANAVPQWPALNRGIWSELEEHCRDVAKSDGVVAVWVVTFSFVAPDGLPAASDTHDLVSASLILGPSHVYVPTHCGKSILIQTIPTKDRDEFSIQTWIIPNKNIPKGTRFDQYRVTTDLAEHWSGLDLWPELDDVIENKLEAIP